LEVVREGIKYRTRKGEPIAREDVEKLNQLVAAVGFKIPELRDPGFLDGLPREIPVEPPTPVPAGPSCERLAELRTQLLDLSKLDPQPRGYAFERFLKELFDAFGLTPRQAFRVQGEQIDGSIEFRGDTYLIEAKWHSELTREKDLLVLQSRTEARTRWSRGLFISYGGFSKDGLTAFSRGRPAGLIAMDGRDLYYILDGQAGLPEVIAAKVRRAAETGEIMVPVQQLLNEGYL